MWVEFVVGSRLAQRIFLQVLRFSSPPEKLTLPNFDLIKMEEPHENQQGWCGFLSKYYNILFIITYVKICSCKHTLRDVIVNHIHY